MAKQHDAIRLLETDHQKVRELFSELMEDQEPSEWTEDTVAELIRAIQNHTIIEEEIFYPAFLEAAEDSEDEHLYYEAIEEHGVVDQVITQLQSADPGSPVYVARMKLMCDLVTHHLDEEEEELFPAVMELCEEETLDEVYEALEARKAELEQETGTPAPRARASKGKKAARKTGKGKVDLNTADEDELSRIKGIGNKRASLLVSYREENGPFEDFDDLEEVEGLDESLIRLLRQETRIGH